MVSVNQRLDQRVVFDTRISTAWRWWRCGYTRISCRWLAEHVIFRLTDDQPSLEYLILTEAPPPPFLLRRQYTTATYPT